MVKKTYKIIVHFSTGENTVVDVSYVDVRLHMMKCH